MSPEQAELDRLDIDTRTDVYSLGVFLYELLTGVHPVRPEARCEGGVRRDLRIIREEEPPRPSTRAAAIGRQLPSVAAQPPDRAAGLSASCARRTRLDRDEGAGEGSRPPLRDRPGTGRRPAALLAAGACDRAPADTPRISSRNSFAGTECRSSRHRLPSWPCSWGPSLRPSAWFARPARKQRHDRRPRHPNRFPIFWCGCSTLSNPDQAPGKPTTVRELLERGAGGIETDLKGQPVVQANLFGTISKVYEALGQYPESKRFAEKALALPHASGADGELQTAAVLLQLGRAHQRLGDMEQTRTSYEQALAVRIRVLGENHLDVARVLNNLGALHGQMERYDEAIAAHERALAIQRRVGGATHADVGHSLRGLAIVEDRRGNIEAGLSLFRQAQEIFEARYGPEHSFTASGLQDIAVSLRTLKRPAEARQLLERSLAILRRVHGPDHPNISFTEHSLGVVLVALGDLKAALPILEDGFRIRMATMGAHNPRTADIASSLALVKVDLGDVEDGVALLEQALQGHEKAYGRDHTSTLETRGHLARSLVKAKRYDDAMPHLEAMVLRDVPEGLRIDLQDPLFDRMRSMPAFRALEAAASRR